MPLIIIKHLENVLNIRQVHKLFLINDLNKILRKVHTGCHKIS